MGALFPAFLARSRYHSTAWSTSFENITARIRTLAAYRIPSSTWVTAGGSKTRRLVARSRLITRTSKSIYNLIERRKASSYADDVLRAIRSSSLKSSCVTSTKLAKVIRKVIA